MYNRFDVQFEEVTMFILSSGTTAASGSLWGMLGIYAIFALVLYFLLIRPQRKQQKETQKMQDSLKTGDWVLLNNGMYGKVVNIVNECLIIEFGTNKSVMIPVLRSQIAGISEPDLTERKVDEAAVEPTNSVVGDDTIEDDLDAYDKKILEKGEKKGFFKKK